jgi:hypothetical protein
MSAHPRNADYPAFPTLDGPQCLTKREYIAALAMQGICADGIPGGHHIPERTAQDAVRYADALLAELAKVQS